MKFFIGLLIGIGIAGGVAFYLNRAQTPFVNKEFNAQSTVNQVSNNNSNPMILAPGTKMQQMASAPVTAQVKNNASTPTNYDFYDILQGKKALNDRKASAPVAQSNTTYLIQVGAFENPDLANDMKARLALLGYSSKIKSSQENNKIINKVVIGPFDAYNRAESVTLQLKEQNINTTIINQN